MIAKLTGIIDEISDNSIILDVAGVGYLISMSERRGLSVGDKHTLYITTIIKPESFELYGFLSKDAQRFFVELIQINGVGPKMGMSILAKLSPQRLQRVIDAKDHTAFKDISRIGTKLAEKIILDMKNKKIVSLSQDSSQQDQNIDNVIDAIDALQQLGISSANAQAAVNEINSKHPNLELEDLISASLEYAKEKRA